MIRCSSIRSCCQNRSYMNDHYYVLIRFAILKKISSIMYCTLTESSFTVTRKINCKVTAVATTTRCLHLTTIKNNSHLENINCNNNEAKYAISIATTKKNQRLHASSETNTSSNILSDRDVTVVTNDTPQQQHSLSDPHQQHQYIMRMTIQWLHGNKGSCQWNRHDVAMAQNLIERWIQYCGNRHTMYDTTTTFSNTNEITIRFLVLILKRWLYNRHPCVDDETKELMHYLYRIISIIQQSTKQQLQQREQVSSSPLSSINSNHTHTNNLYTNSYHLLQSFYSYSIQLNEPKLLPKPKAYSMVLETFSNAILQKQKATTSVTSNLNYTNHQINHNVEEDSFIKMADQLMEQLDTAIMTSQAYYLQYQSDIIVAYNSYLQLLARYANLRQDQQIAEKGEYFLLHKMAQPNLKSYTAVIQCWVNINSPKRAMELLDCMIQNGIIPDQVCYNICLYALGNCGYAKEAHEMLCNMIQIAKDTHDANMFPDAYSYLAVIKAYTKCNESNMAIQLFEQMIQQQSQYQNVNIRNNNNNHNHIAKIYTTILDALARKPNSGPNVELMLQYMEELYEQTGIGQPCREAYTIAIRAWGQMTKTNIIAPDRATDIFRRMQNKSVQLVKEPTLLDHRNDLSPCKISYTTLINAWAQSYRIDAPQNALQILRHMEQQQKYQIPNVLTVDICPDTITYNTVLNAFARHGLASEAHQLLNEMKLRMAADHDRKYSTMYPNVISYATVMQSYRNSSRSDVDIQANTLLLEIEDLYDRTGNESLQPTPDLYSIAILAQSTNIETAEKIFWRMVDRYEKKYHMPLIDNNELYAPNTYVCNALLRLWSKSDDPVAPQRAETILNWMERLSPNKGESSITPNYDSYKFVLLAWYKSKRRNAHQYIQIIESKIKLHYPNIQ